MGGRSSKQSSFRHSSSLGSSSSSWSPQGFVPQNQNYASPNYAPSQGYAPPPQSQGYAPPPQYYGPQVTEPQRTFESRYSRIADNYSSLEQVTEALSQAGLESSNLIVGIDFTKSNEWTGARSFNRRSLHHIEDTQNPYEQAISIIGKTLSVFDEDNLIPCFGFGDATTHDLDVFSFYPDESLCNGFEEALARYREIVPHLKLAGPTSFAPIIEMATTIVDQSRGHSACERVRVAPIMYTTKSTETLATIGAKYVGDPDKNDSGYFVEVTRSIDTACGQLSPQEQKTVEAIVKASEYPLSIILVGVGDGPWDMMREFDDNIPTRAFDNFQFVNFTEIMSKNIPLARKETEFALSALMEIPSQYKATLELNILGSRNGKAQERVPLPPPLYGTDSFNLKKPSSSRSFQQRSPPYPSHGTSMSTVIPPSAAAFDNKVCPICFTNVKDMAFGCGHQTCCDCGQNLEFCPICRLSIVTRIKLY